MGIEYDLKIVSTQEFDKLMADPENSDLYIGILHGKGKEGKVDLGKKSARTMFDIVENLGKLYNLDNLQNFPYFKEMVSMDEESHDSFYKPDLVKRVAEALKQVTREQFDKAYAGADKFYDDYTEEGREWCFKYTFTPMVELFNRAAEKGEGMIFSWG